MREVWLGSTVVGAEGGGPGDGVGVAEETEELRCRDGACGTLGTPGTPEKLGSWRGFCGGVSLLHVYGSVFPNCILSFCRAS